MNAIGAVSELRIVFVVVEIFDLCEKFFGDFVLKEGKEFVDEESVKAFHSGFHEQGFHHKGSHSYLFPFFQKSIQSEFEVNFLIDPVLQQANKLSIIAHVQPLLKLLRFLLVS